VDACGPFPPSAKNGYQYIIQYVDSATRYTWAFGVKGKEDSHLTLKKFKQSVLDPNLAPNGHVTFRSDGGTEFVHGEYRKLIDEYGYNLEITARETPEWNGIVEAKIRDVKIRTYSIMKHAKGLHSLKRFWVHAYQYATYLSNMLYTEGWIKDIPYRQYWNKDPPVKYLKVWGCIAYAAKPKTSKKQLNERNDKCIFVGHDPNYSEGTYLLWKLSTGEFIRSKDVNFDEDTLAGTDTAPHTLPESVDVITAEKAPSITFLLMSGNSDVELIGNEGEAQEPHEETEEQQSTTNNSEDSSTTTIRMSHRLGGKHVPVHFNHVYLPDDVDEDGFEHYDPTLFEAGSTSQPDTTDEGTNGVEEQKVAEVHEEMVGDADNNEDNGHDEAASEASPNEPDTYFNQALKATQRVKNTPADVKEDFIPKTVEEALQSEDCESWRQAVIDEWMSLIHLKVFRRVRRPRGARVLKSGFVFAVKRNTDGELIKFKARFVAKGYSQKKGIDYANTFSPVADSTTIKLIIALAALMKWTLENADVPTAYLNASLSEIVYIECPDLFKEDGEDVVLLLDKALYGLVQSAMEWNNDMDRTLTAMGFVSSPVDPCLYIFRGETQMDVILCLYVDDLLITGANREKINSVMEELQNKYKIKLMGKAKEFLGCKIISDDDSFYLSQEHYVEKVVSKFISKLPNSDRVSPAIANTTIGSEEDKPHTDLREFQSLVGSLLHATRWTRPDISNAVREVSRHMGNATSNSFKQGIRTLSYLNGTKDLSLQLGGQINSDTPALEIYADASYISEIDGKSVTGVVAYYYGSLIFWQSKTQEVVAQSSAESEYIALCTACRVEAYLRQLIEFVHDTKLDTTMIHEDNQGAILIANGHMPGKRTRHMMVRYHYVRECIARKRVAIAYIETVKQKADGLTKNLQAGDLHRSRTALCLATPPPTNKKSVHW
jgi:hypothetical protein